MAARNSSPSASIPDKVSADDSYISTLSSNISACASVPAKDANTTVEKDVSEKSPTEARIINIIDPCKTVSWGPITRARIIQLSKQERLKMIKGRGRFIQKESENSNKTVTPAGSASLSPTEPASVDAVVLTSRTLGETAAPAAHDPDEAASVMSTTASVSTQTTHSMVPSDPEIFYAVASFGREAQSLVNIAPPSTPAATPKQESMTMPTIPCAPTHAAANHRDIVERYRAERALNPVAFDRQTRLIKAEQLQLKIARGGQPLVLAEEYTVELACREQAQYEARFERVERPDGMRSRGNTMSGPGEMEDIKLPPPFYGRFASATVSPSLSSRSLVDNISPDSAEPEFVLPEGFSFPGPAGDDIVTSGTISSQRRETYEESTDKNICTVKTSIEITEVYEIPKGFDRKGKGKAVRGGMRAEDLLKALAGMKELQEAREEGVSDLATTAQALGEELEALRLAGELREEE